MGLRINSASTLAAQRNILLQQRQLQTNLQQLSTGLRINTASDSPAGLAISEQLRARIGGQNALAENAARAVGLVQTAEGALAEINTQLNEIRGLAIQAGNGAVLGETGLQAIQEQITRATDTITRIAETTEFAGRSLLNGTFRGEQFAIAERNPAELAIPDVAAGRLGREIENQSGFANLAEIDVTTPRGAADSILIVDAAINEVSNARSDLGAFQTNVLETASRSLGVNRANLAASESTVRDANIASAASESALLQLRLQAGVLAQNFLNQRSGMVLDVLA